MTQSQPTEKTIVILGPTASGKSDLAIQIAHYVRTHKNALGISNVAIISADSRQVYRGLDIGSGKVTKKEMRGITHYGLDIASPKRRFTVSQYQRYVKKTLQKLQKQNIIPIICGGTGLYIDSVLYNYSFPEVKPNLSLRKKLEKLTTEKLFTLLQKKSPVRAQTIDRHNRRRLIRALEILENQKHIPPLVKKPLENTLVLGINPSLETLRKRIHLRLTKRLRSGMIAEVQKLHTQGISYERLDSFGLEYRYISRFLKGTLTKQEMTEQLEKEIQQYAKRQMTWFKRNRSIVWLHEANLNETLQNNILTFLRM